MRQHEPANMFDAGQMAHPTANRYALIFNTLLEFATSAKIMGRPA